MSKPLTITRFEASNVMRLKAVNITPDGNVILTGKNGAGKSSVLTGIASILSKKSVPAKLLRTGESEGHAIMELGNLVVTMDVTPEGRQIKVTSTDGSTAPRTLEKMWNECCDPVKFIKLSDSPEGRREQAAILSKMVGLDFTEVNKKRQQLYDERESVGRDKRASEGKLQGFPVHGGVPNEEQSASALMDNLTEIQKHNGDNSQQRSKVSEKRRAVEYAQASLRDEQARLHELERQVEKCKETVANFNELANTRQSELEDLEAAEVTLEDRDEKPIRDQIAALDGVNSKVRANKQHLDIQREIQGHNTTYASLTLKIDKIDTEKRTQLESAPFPYPGLSFDETGVLLDGEPFSQGSQAQQLVAAAAIGLALKPAIGVVIIREASLFDDETLKRVADLAARENAQVWLEIVKSDDPSAVIIEDGQVKQ